MQLTTRRRESSVRKGQRQDQLLLAAAMGLLVVAFEGAGLSLGVLSPADAEGPECLRTGRAAGLSSSPGVFSVRSEAFQSGADIPAKFTCEGSDTSPALEWTEPPPGTRSLALIADDPDAPGGTFVHWVLYDLPAGTRQLTEAVPRREEVAGGGSQGTNDFGKIGYGGPCPPPGRPHRYYFKLYALDIKLSLNPGATKRDVESAMKGHILALAETMGRYRR